METEPYRETDKALSVYGVLLLRSFLAAHHLRAINITARKTHAIPFLTVIGKYGEKTPRHNLHKGNIHDFLIKINQNCFTLLQNMV